MSSNMDPPPKQPAPSPLMQLTPADEAELARCRPSPLPPPATVALRSCKRSSNAHCFTLVVREASEVISLMDKGAINRDGIMLELRGDKHPLLFRHCVYGERESCTKKVMPIEGQMYRLHLQHAAFSGQLLQV